MTLTAKVGSHFVGRYWASVWQLVLCGRYTRGFDLNFVRNMCVIHSLCKREPCSKRSENAHQTNASISIVALSCLPSINHQDYTLSTVLHYVCVSSTTISDTSHIPLAKVHPESKFAFVFMFRDAATWRKIDTSRVYAMTSVHMCSIQGEVDVLRTTEVRSRYTNSEEKKNTYEL